LEAQPGSVIVIGFSAPRSTTFVVALVFSALATGNPAAAQSPLACTTETLGMTACLESKLCACIYDRGGIASGMPAGYRWDCGILRPGCGSSVHPPATLDPYEGPYPQALSIDKSRQSLTVRQTNANAKTGVKTNNRSNSEKRTPEAWHGKRTPEAWHGAPLRLLPPD
jgi:hypothetical protein